MSVLTETNFWFRIRLTKVQRLSVKSKTNEKVGGFFSEVKNDGSFFIMIQVSKLLRTGVKLPGLHCRIQLLENRSRGKQHHSDHTTSATVPVPEFPLLYIPPPSCLSPCTFLLRDHYIHRRLRSRVTRTSLLPGLSDKIYALSTSLAPIKQLNLLVV